VRRRVVPGQQAIVDGGQAQQGQAGALMALGLVELGAAWSRRWPATGGGGLGQGSGRGGQGVKVGHGVLARVTGRSARLRTSCHGRTR
jgi:hypothetical protein